MSLLNYQNICKCYLSIPDILISMTQRAACQLARAIFCEMQCVANKLGDSFLVAEPVHSLICHDRSTICANTNKVFNYFSVRECITDVSAHLLLRHS